MTLGADKSDDAADFVPDLRELDVPPHVAQKFVGSRSAIDDRTARYEGDYESSQRERNRWRERHGSADIVF